MLLINFFDETCKTLLYCVHYVISVVVYLKNWWEHYQRQINLGAGDFHKLNVSGCKLPHHIIFVINCNDNCLTIEDVASLVHWSILLGISNISLYDNEGFLPLHKDDLEIIVSQKLGSKEPIKFRSSQQNGSTEHNIIFHCDFDSSKIRILSMLNSKAILAMVLKELVKVPLEGKCNEKLIRPADIDRSLFAKLNLPDPELAVICGPTPCLLGCLPWHLRLTEIINLPLFGRLVPQDFISVMNRYAKCEQRFGK